jgi:hypothetical protein
MSNCHTLAPNDAPAPPSNARASSLARVSRSREEKRAVISQQLPQRTREIVIWGIVRGYARPEVREESRAGATERRGIATKVQQSTNFPAADHDALSDDELLLRHAACEV